MWTPHPGCACIQLASLQQTHVAGSLMGTLSSLIPVKVHTKHPLIPTPIGLQTSQLGFQFACSGPLPPQLRHVTLQAAALAWPDALDVFPATTAFMKILYHWTTVTSKEKACLDTRAACLVCPSTRTRALWTLIPCCACCQPCRQQAPLLLQPSLTSSAVAHRVSTLTRAAQPCAVDSTQNTARD